MQRGIHSIQSKLYIVLELFFGYITGGNVQNRPYGYVRRVLAGDGAAQYARAAGVGSPLAEDDLEEVGSQKKQNVAIVDYTGMTTASGQHG